MVVNPRYFNFLILGLVAGVWLGSFIDWGWGLILLPLVIGLGLLFLNKNKYALVSVICLGLTLGLLRIYLTPQPSSELVERVGSQVEFNGTITDEPDRRDNQTRLTVRPDGFTDQVLVVADPYGSYHYGDRFAFTGTLNWPKDFETEAGKIFAYKKYLAKDNIFWVLDRPQLTALPEQGGNLIIKELFKIKTSFVNRLNQLLPEPESSLAAGLLAGEKQALGKEWSDRFRTVGLSHIIVLSGYNLSVVAENILRLAGLILSKNLSLLAGALGIITFGLMVGGGATVLRASIMALIALLARATGRQYQATIALLVAGALMLMWNPKILVYDLGFQLSFLATLGVIYGPVLLAPYFYRVPERGGLRETLLTTISAQIIVLPWILYSTGNLSLIALPANLLVLPVIPLTMLFGFLSVFIAPLAFIAHLFLKYILVVVKIFSLLPLAAVTIKTFPLILVFICYAGIFYFAYRQNKITPSLASDGAKISTD
jgi:competence protein ComEC